MLCNLTFCFNIVCYFIKKTFQSLEDLVVHYDGSVRNADGDVVQLVYGCDGLDPTYMEGKLHDKNRIVNKFVEFSVKLIVHIITYTCYVFSCSGLCVCLFAVMYMFIWFQCLLML